MGDALKGVWRVAAVQLIVFTLGSVVMGFEMLASRYLYPYFGGSIETWAALISTVLAALMVGYYAGGYLVDRRPDLRVSALLVALAAGWIGAVPALAKVMLPVLLDTMGDGPLVTITASAMLLFLPLACLGTLLPFVVRVILADLAHAGRVAGLCYAVSTMGNIFGTLFVTFTLIPMFGISLITQIFAAVTAVGAVGLFFLRRM